MGLTEPCETCYDALNMIRAEECTICNGSGYIPTQDGEFMIHRFDTLKRELVLAISRFSSR